MKTQDIITAKGAKREYTKAEAMNNIGDMTRNDIISRGFDGNIYRLYSKTGKIAMGYKVQNSDTYIVTVEL